MHGRHLLAALALLASVALAACGGDEGGGGARAINWYVFNEPGGAYDKAVADCNKQAGGTTRSTTSSCRPTPTSSAS